MVYISAYVYTVHVLYICICLQTVHVLYICICLQIERLRKEGNRILQETQEQLRRDLEEHLLKPSEEKDVAEHEDSTTAKVKVVP